MDNTESDQEASAQSSPEDTLRHFDFLSEVSPGFFPLSSLRIDRSPEEETEEEVEDVQRESPEHETTSQPETPRTLRRRLRFATPIDEPISPLPSLSPPEEREGNMASAAEVAALTRRLAALEALLAACSRTGVARSVLRHVIFRQVECNLLAFRQTDRTQPEPHSWLIAFESLA